MSLRAAGLQAPGSRVAVGTPSTSSSPQVVEESSTLTQIDGNSSLYFGTMYDSFVLEPGYAGVATVFTLSGESTTSDWYLVGVGYDLNLISFYSSAGCKSGYELVYVIENNAGGLYSDGCLTSPSFASGDTVTLGLNYTSSSPNNMGWVACAGATCSGYYIGQPDPSANGFSLSSTARTKYGGFTGPMTWLMDPNTGACSAYPGMPKVDYNFHAGIYITQYVPWSQEWDTNLNYCYNPATSVTTLAPNSPLTVYDEASGGSSYGPHWVAGQNVSLQSTLSASYWWRFQTDITPLGIPSLTASRSTADVNQSVNFTAGGTGGSAPYSFSWYLNSVLQGTTSSSWTWTPSTPAAYTAYTYVLDADVDYYGPSSSVSVNVSSDPTVGAPTPAPPSGGIDQGQSVNFTSAVPSGGLAPYTYGWLNLPTGCSSANSNTIPCVPTGSGTFPVSVKVTDANAFSVTGPSLSYTVDGPLTANLTGLPSAVDLGQTTNLTVSASGGSGKYSYVYSGLPQGCATASVTPLPCTPTTPGNASVSVIVTDGNLASVTTNTFQLVVNPDLTISTSLAASPNPVTVGSSVTLSVGASGGTLPYHYLYGGLPSGCSTQNAASFSCQPSTAGTYNLSVSVTDSSGKTSSSTATLKVLSKTPPSISSFAAIPATIQFGQTSNLTVVVTGGSTPYTYAYTSLPAGCASANRSVLPCAPSGVGVFTIDVKVTGANGLSAMGSALLNVSKSAAVPTITSFAAVPATVPVGQTTTLTVVVSGGTFPYSFIYSQLPLGCSSGNTSSLACNPTAAGNYTVSVLVTDGAGLSAPQKSTSLTVTQVGGPVISSFSAVPDVLGVGGTSTLSVAVSGGTPPYTYVYTGLPPDCASTDASSLHCIPTSPGNFTIRVTVTDSAGKSVSKTLVLEVTGQIKPLAVVLATNAASVVIGSSVLLSASIIGGIGPFTYTWAVNGTNVSYGPDAFDWSVSLAHSGTFEFRIWVKDAAGQTDSSSSVQVQVTPSVTKNSEPVAFPWWILLLVIVAVVAGLLFYSGRRYQVSRETPQGTIPESPPSDTAYPCDAATAVPIALEQTYALPEGSVPYPAAKYPGPGYELASPVESPPPEMMKAEGAPVGTLSEPMPRPTPGAGSPEAPAGCPHCGGPLSEGSDCHACGVSWVLEGEQAMPSTTPQTEPPPMDPASPPYPQLECLSQCPQCGTPLDPNLSCPACNVVWEPSAPEGELAQVQDIPSPEVSPEEMPPEVSDIQSELEQARQRMEREKAIPASTDASGGSSLPSTSPPSSDTPYMGRVCLVCGGALAGNYCSVCDMHWDHEGPR